MKENRKDRKKRISALRGLVIPNRWNGVGEVTGVALASFDEKIFHVKDGPGVAWLLPFLREEIEVVGEIQSLEDGRELLEIKGILTYPPLA
ncbi:MAG: hypothetical protein V1816_24565 [Pseudomonadota bacterium]